MSIEMVINSIDPSFAMKSECTKPNAIACLMNTPLPIAPIQLKYIFETGAINYATPLIFNSIKIYVN